MKFSTINPATEENIAEYEIMDKAAVDERVARARRAFETWQETSLAERTKLVKKLGKKILAKKSDPTGGGGGDSQQHLNSG